MAYKALDVAKYIIQYSSENGNEITNLRLQKILYYIQGYFFKKFNAEAFSEYIYNWPYGPVVKDVYYEYNKFVASAITLDESVLDIECSKKERELISVVIDKCFEYKPFELVNKTHQEEPWAKTNKFDVIPNTLIFDYFCKNNPLFI